MNASIPSRAVPTAARLSTPISVDRPPASRGALSLATVVRLGREVAASEPVLVGAGLVLIPLFFLFSVGIVLDPRVILGAPLWLKPAKFAISTAIYCLTLAWVFRALPEWRRTRLWVGRITAAVMLFEVAVVALQAARGTTSHFNISTVPNAVLFFLMGLAIGTQTLASVAVAIALFRQRFDDRAMGWALRAGMTFTILGASLGGLMTARPTEAQLAELRLTGRLTTAGAHTVGGPDGGPGLPGVGWSTAHGDLRVPHFFGLHALQVLPLVAFLARRRFAARSPFVVAGVAVAYGLVFFLLTAQALAGIPVIAVANGLVTGAAR